MRVTCLLLFLAAAVPALAAADPGAGRVVAVTTGDTLTVEGPNRERIRLRLLGIDAPEPEQDFGRQSQTGLAGLAMGKEIRFEGDKKDRQGFTIARVWTAEATNCGQPPAACPKPMDVGLAQVAAGLAWQDPLSGKQLPAADQQRYAEAEFMAKIRRQGLWAGKNRRFPLTGQLQRFNE